MKLAPYPDSKRRSDFDSSIWGYAVLRPLSRRLAALLAGRMSPTFITVVWIGLIVAALAAGACGLDLVWIAWILNLALWLDYVDGDLARCTGRSSILGAHLDIQGGLLLMVAPYVAAGMVLGSEQGPFWLSAGLLAALLIALRRASSNERRILIARQPRTGEPQSEAEGGQSVVSRIGRWLTSVDIPLFLIAAGCRWVELWLLSYLIFHAVTTLLQVILDGRRLARG